ncbi:hypothetical protein ACO0QE_000372 [Hanseniaspora vineae]
MSFSDPWTDNNIPSMNAELESVISSLSQISNPQPTNTNTNTNTNQYRVSQQIGAHRRSSMTSNSDMGSDILVPHGTAQSLTSNIEYQNQFQQNFAKEKQTTLGNNNNAGLHIDNSPILRRTTLSVGGYSLNGGSSNQGPSAFFSSNGGFLTSNNANGSPSNANANISANNANNNTLKQTTNVNGNTNNLANPNRMAGYAASIAVAQQNANLNSNYFNPNQNSFNNHSSTGASGTNGGSFFEAFGKQLVEATKEVEGGTNLVTDEELTVQQFVTSSSRSASLQVDAFTAHADSRQNSNFLGEEIGVPEAPLSTSRWNPETARSFYPSAPMGPGAHSGFPFNGLFHPLGLPPHHHHPHSFAHNPPSAGTEKNTETDYASKTETSGVPAPIASPPHFFINPYLAYGATPPPPPMPLKETDKDKSKTGEAATSTLQPVDLSENTFTPAYFGAPDPTAFEENGKINPYQYGQAPFAQDYPYGNNYFQPMGMASPLASAPGSAGFAPPKNGQGNGGKYNKGNPYLKNRNGKGSAGSKSNGKAAASVSALHHSPQNTESAHANKPGASSKHNGKRRKEPVHRSPKLEEFVKSSKDKNYELGELYGHAYEFCKDQVGSRFIQDKLPTASDTDKEMIFSEIRDHALELMDDVFGNYVIQLFFELGSDIQREALVQSVLGHVLDLTQSQYGCRIIQKSLMYVTLEQKILIVDELKDYVYDCIKDQNGNHVIQKAIENIPLEKLPYILESLKGQIYHFSTHPYGCRVVQRLLEFGSEGDRKLVLQELKNFFPYLIQNEFGNYVVQYILKSSAESSTQDMLEVKQDIVDLVCNKIVDFSCHKYASNVVEQILFLGSEAQKKQLFDVIIPKTENDALELKDSELIAIMMKDQFANYVIQKLVKVTSGENKRLLVISIRSYLNQVKATNHNANGGRKQKHLASVEKLAALVSNLSV